MVKNIKIRRIGRRVLSFAVPLLVALAAAGGVYAVSLLPNRQTRLEVLPPRVVNVEVRPVVVHPSVSDTFELQGEVERNWVVRVAAEVGGRVERYAEALDPRGGKLGRPLRKGDHVIAGQPLMFLNTDLLRAEYNRVKAEVEFASRDLKRIERAAEQGVATPLQVDEVRTAVARTQAQLEDIEARLARAKICSEVDGTLNDLPVEVGEYVQRGQMVAEITDMDTVKVAADVPEKDIRYLRAGQKVRIFDRLSGRVDLTGRITYISETADPVARTTRIEISVPNEDRKLHDKQIVSVELKRRDLENVILIPLDAAIPEVDGGKLAYSVYVVEDGKAVARRVGVDLSFISGKQVRVTEGSQLKAGDRLIVTGNRMCGPGQPVRVVNEPAAPPATAPATQPAHAADAREVPADAAL